MVELDGTSGDLVGTSEFYFSKLLRWGTFGSDSQIMGVRHELEFESSSGDYYVHLIYQQANHEIWYLRTSPTTSGSAYA